MCNVKTRVDWFLLRNSSQGGSVATASRLMIAQGSRQASVANKTLSENSVPPKENQLTFVRSVVITVVR